MFVFKRWVGVDWGLKTWSAENSQLCFRSFTPITNLPLITWSGAETFYAAVSRRISPDCSLLFYTIASWASIFHKQVTATLPITLFFVFFLVTEPKQKEKEHFLFRIYWGKCVQCTLHNTFHAGNSTQRTGWSSSCGRNAPFSKFYSFIYRKGNFKAGGKGFKLKLGSKFWLGLPSAKFYFQQLLVFFTLGGGVGRDDQSLYVWNFLSF